VGWLASAGIWSYRRALRLYPAAFRAAFAEEMGEVFAAALQEAAGEGGRRFLWVLGRELVDLPVALLLAHVRERRGKKMPVLGFDSQGDVRRVRWMARWMAFLFAAFVASLFAFNEDVRGDPTPPILVLAAVAVALLSCWRWERLGGLLTLAGSAALFVAVVVMVVWPGLYGLERAGGAPPGVLLAGLALALSPAGLGWLFLSLAGQPGVAAGERRERPRPSGRGMLIYVLIAFVVFFLLGLSAVVVPFSLSGGG
jgi:hypothetical protein